VRKKRVEKTKNSKRKTCGYHRDKNKISNHASSIENPVRKCEGIRKMKWWQAQR
jgi:hypothetical protein